MKMKKSKLNIVDDKALSLLRTVSPSTSWIPSHADWIRILRSYLRMTQEELAHRAGITQANLVKIESGKTNPRVDTLRRIFEGLSCDLLIEPRPQKPIDELLRGRARSIALKRLKQAMGTMALENQAPGSEAFLQLLEKRTDEILQDPSERLWNKKDE